VSEKRWIVPLPRGAEPPYRVFVSGVPQKQGEDYEVRGHALAFSRELKKEGRLGFWPWLLMFLSIRGVYRRNDSVDVQYRHAGKERVATGLDIIPPAGEEDSGS
jgi:hypothetical protein